MNITITKKITLVGAGKDTTVIDGGNTGGVVGVYGSADYARIANFTIRNGKDSTASKYPAVSFPSLKYFAER